MIQYLKNKYYWWKINKKLKSFFDTIQDSKILLIGYPKSGNTWLRFLLFNYKKIYLNQEKELVSDDLNQVETITYDELNYIIQPNVMDRGTVFSPIDKFPLFYRTHAVYQKPYNLFDFKIFIHRNPLDTLISSYYFYRDRKTPFHDEPHHIVNKLHDIDFYVKYKIDNWINFFYISKKHADIIINYTDLINNSYVILQELIQKLNWEIDPVLIKKTIEISSFENIKKMGVNYEQNYGNGPKDGSFFGEFARSGREGQYHDELKKETINYVINKFPDFYKLYNF